MREVKRQNPHVLVETLAGDFRGVPELTRTLLDSGLDVYSHNIETTRALTPKVRDPRAGYDQTLEVLRIAKQHRPDLVTKSSVMLGLGETREDVLQTMRDVRRAGAEIFTLGQYLRPTRRHLAVERYVTPEEFQDYEAEGLKMGYAFVASGPLVRSSYRAGEFFLKAFVEKRRAAGG